MSPSFAPVSMNAAITRVYAVIASWTPWTVVSRSATIWLIDTFMTLLSSTITNCAAARTAIGSQFIRAAAGRSPAASPLVPVTSASHAEAGAGAVVPVLAHVALRRLRTGQVARIRRAQDPVHDRPDDREDEHQQQPGDRVLGVEPAPEDVHDAEDPGNGDRDGDDDPEKRQHAAILRAAPGSGNGVRRCPAGCARTPARRQVRAVAFAPRMEDARAMTTTGTHLEQFRTLRAELEQSILPLAGSIDGRAFALQSPLHGLELELGGYVMLE